MNSNKIKTGVVLFWTAVGLYTIGVNLVEYRYNSKYEKAMKPVGNHAADVLISRLERDIAESKLKKAIKTYKSKRDITAFKQLNEGIDQYDKIDSSMSNSYREMNKASQIANAMENKLNKIKAYNPVNWLINR